MVKVLVLLLKARAKILRGERQGLGSNKNHNNAVWK